MAEQNVWHRRLVAEANAKACWICYKPTSTVLITADGATDWFHICPGHLTDTKFALAQDTDDVARKRHDEDIEKEIEKLKKEFTDKMKEKVKKKDKSNKEKKDEAEDTEQLEKAQEEKLKALEEKKQTKEKTSGDKAHIDGPRVFALHKSFFQMRQQRKAQTAAAKRQQERMRNPTLFPSVPKDL